MTVAKDVRFDDDGFTDRALCRETTGVDVLPDVLDDDAATIRQRTTRSQTWLVRLRAPATSHIYRNSISPPGDHHFVSSRRSEPFSSYLKTASVAC